MVFINIDSKKNSVRVQESHVTVKTISAVAGSLDRMRQIFCSHEILQEWRNCHYLTAFSIISPLSKTGPALPPVKLDLNLVAKIRNNFPISNF